MTSTPADPSARTGRQRASRAPKQVLSVAQLNDAVRALLESELGFVWVEGEISNLVRPRSGHLYFTLKDTQAQLRCAMFRNRNVSLTFRPEDGLAVVAYGRVSLYAPRGDYQLIVEALEPAGEGLLRLRFEQLKQKLQAEGLFDQQAKRALPAWPRRIGLVTSPSGAAVRDILTVLKRRCSAIPVILYPATVQGESAAATIESALAIANRRAECDVLIVGRGGGSLEDLWPFNEERVARALHDSDIPVVSAVGHEIDFTIADMVADLRAATPSAAAELVSPDLAAIRNGLDDATRRLRRLVSDDIARARSELSHLGRRLVSPGRRLEQSYQRTDELAQRLSTGMTRHLEVQRSRLQALATRAFARSPRARVDHSQQELGFLQARLQAGVTTACQRRQDQLQRLADMLGAVSPVATLKRGYAIVTDASGDIVREAASLSPGDALTTRVANGAFDSRVTTIADDSTRDD